MVDKSITVLGGGNTAFGIAANLTLRGYEITLYEVPEFSDTLEPLKGNRGITLNGVAEVGEARIHKTTTDIAPLNTVGMIAMTWIRMSIRTVQSSSTERMMIATA